MRYPCSKYADSDEVCKVCRAKNPVSCLYNNQRPGLRDFLKDGSFELREKLVEIIDRDNPYFLRWGTVIGYHGDKYAVSLNNDKYNVIILEREQFKIVTIRLI